MATNQSSKRIGVLGGTFNPVHTGHLLMARDVLEQARLDVVELVPCHTPSHKTGEALVQAQHRLRMLRLAVRGVNGLRVNDLDIKRGGVTYSVDTVAAMRSRQPGAEIFFIIGSDSLRDLKRWKEFERLNQMCSFIVVARPGHPVRRLPGVRLEAVVTVRQCEISSTEIRKRIARGQGIHYLVPDAVRKYIERETLYR
jgi:nicotinate-nucleotide adenylyltransferase